MLVARWRAATPPQRRTLAPLLWSGVVLMVLVAGSLERADRRRNGDDVTDVLTLVGQIVFASVPFTFLIGLLRSRVARADAVGELLVRLGEAPGTDGLRGLLAEALGDRSLQLAAIGSTAAGSSATAGRRAAGRRDRRRAWTPVELEGQRVGAIVHDRSLRARARGAQLRRRRRRAGDALAERLEAGRCAARAPGSSRPAWRSAGGWSATCTTAPSSGSSRCR